MKRLDFFPYYSEILRNGRKTTTFRLGKVCSVAEGEEVMVTAGWDEQSVRSLRKAKIISVYHKRSGDPTEQDFQGESADCTSIPVYQVCARLHLPKGADGSIVDMGSKG